MEFKDILKEVIESKDITPYKIGKDTSISKQSIMNYISGKNDPTIGVVKELSTYLNVPIEYLIGSEVIKVTDVVNDNNNDINLNDNFLLVPLYSQDVVGGINNQEMDSNGYITGYMPFVNAKPNDICVPVTSNSMEPIYPSGTIVQIRKLEYWKEFVEFGKVHIIELNDERRLIKVIREGKDKEHFTLVSHNPNFDNADISIDFIRSVWLVLSKYQKVVM